MQEHKPVGIAHSSEEMFEHDDCNALNALDFLAPPFASRQKVEDIKLNINVLMKHSIYQFNKTSSIVSRIKNQDSRIENQDIAHRPCLKNKIL